MTNNKTKKIETQSSDIGIEEVKKLATIFPQFVKDGKIDFDAMKAWFDNEKLTDNYEKFGLRFAGKQEAFDAIRRSSTGTLVPDKEQSVNWDETKNIFIEGENLEVLKLLQSHYRGKIKMIYIDPPYNTGKDFVYHDNFTKTQSDYYEKTSQTQDGIKMVSNPESNGRYHSDWLTMMYPRLFLAKNLLRDDGVIFVSIDDHEVAHLRMIMDEIYGEDNYLSQITIVGNPRGRDYGGVAKMHDYLLCYKRSDLGSLNNLNVKDKVFDYQDDKGGFDIRELRNRNIAFHVGNRPNLYYPFYINTSHKDSNGFFEIALEKKAGWIELFPKESQGYKTVWRWGREKSKNFLNKEITAKKMEDGGFQIIEKYREMTKMARSVWWDKEDNTEKGTLETKELFMGKKFFDFPKSKDMIRKVVEMGCINDGLVLDFFAGSGTTAHAVMDLNAEDGGNRKYICVQLPETTSEDSEAYKAGYKNITQIARERIRRAGAKIGKGDTGFKAYKLAPSHYRQWQKMDTEETTPDQYVQILKLFTEKPLIDNYDEQSVVHEIFLKEGFDLHVKIGKHNISGLEIYSVEDDEKRLFVCFAKSISYEDIEAIKMKDSDTFVCFDSALTDTVKVNAQRNWTIKTI